MHPTFGIYCDQVEGSIIQFPQISPQFEGTVKCVIGWLLEPTLQAKTDKCFNKSIVNYNWSIIFVYQYETKPNFKSIFPNITKKLIKICIGT